LIKKTYTDSDGYKHLTLCAEGDEPENGIHQDPPLVGNIDWHEIEKELHNRLVDAEMTDWRKVQGGIPLTGIINSVIKPKIVMVFKLAEQGEL
jgi:hypothetical protein